MKDRGPWRLWSTLLLLLTGSLCFSTAQSQSYSARGDQGDNSPAALGFDGVVSRHDGYVKGETPTIPQTSFSCSAQPYNPGLYADVETQCQVYHVCFEDRQESFLCGPGTNFNQRILACDFWYNFNCGDSPSFYSANADIGKVPDKIPGYRPDQGSRTPYQPQPQPQQPRPQPQQPRPQPQPQQPRPQPQPQQPRPQIQQPRPQPQPQQPRPRPQPQPQQPRPQPQQPRPQPQRPSYPEFPQQPAQPPSTGSFPDRVRIPSPAPQPFQPQPQPPRQPADPYQPAQPQPPSFPSPPPFRPAPRPQPPVFRPQPRPEPPRRPQEPLYPGVPCGSGYQGGGGRPCPPATQQEEQDGYQFDGQKPPKRIALPPPPPPPRDTPRPVFPPVVSPPRVSRPPLTPPVVRQPEISRPRVPVIDNRSEYHPDADIKGGTGSYRPPQPPRQPQPSRPVGTGYPSYPVAQRPAEKPSRPSYQPPPTLQQEHVDTEFVPPPKEPSRPSTSYVPPPPPPPLPPAQQEVIHTRPPQPAYVPPPAVKKPDESNYVRPQPPVSPSVIREQQRPVSRPSRPRPVFPPASDHPNSNIKGGPGYNQPPPQVPRFEPTRISRPSSPQGGYRPPPPAPQQRPVSSGSTATAVKPAAVKRPSAPSQAVYKPDQGRIKKPSEPQRSVYQPPIQVIDHPQSEVKGERYEPPIRQEPQRVQSPSTSVSGIKRPQPSRQRPQVERPRAPVVVSRPQPPSLPAANVKTVDNQIYDRPQPPAPVRVKEPSVSRPQAVSRPSQPSYPDYDHPNANVKGGYSQRISRPSGPSSSYDQRPVSGGGYQPDYNQPDYKPSRSSPPGSVKTANNIPRGSSPVKDASGGHDRPLSGSQHSVLVNNQVRPDYEAGSSYTRGPEVYPKPEFGRPNTPHQPVSTPSRQAAKLGSPSQNDITRSQVKPGSSAAGSGPRSDVRADYPYQVPGHQPPHQRQVFPHRDNPDHPNESLKGSNAYRPPPPAGFQASASEVQEQQVQPEPEPEPSSDSKLGDTGSE